MTHSRLCAPTCDLQLEFRCTDGSCILREKACNGQEDCVDGSDEHQCGHTWCKKDKLLCQSGRCLHQRLFCDGVDDCGDGSDEISCRNCSPGFFSCGQTDVCLPRLKLCDGQKDCRDGGDETEALCGLTKPQAAPSCSESEFQCGDGHCVRLSWRCDGSPECSDGSDEMHCDRNECLVDNGGCSHQCVDLAMGFHCSCPENMRLVEDRRCEEVDLCLDKDVCDQLCVHTNSSFTCDCTHGYMKQPRTSECKAKGEKAQLVFAANEVVGAMYLTGSTWRKVTTRSSSSGPVAVLMANHTLFWARRGSINRVSLRGNPHEALSVFKVQGSVSGLAVDWIHHLIYWTSVESNSVSVGLLDGSAQRRIIQGLDQPSALTVDPLQGYLFFANRGESPKIVRTTLAGRDRLVLVGSGIRRPVALTLDLPRQLLYWADEGTRSISRVTLAGRHRKTVVESNGYLDRPVGLAVFEGFLYWTDQVTHSICRANKHNGGQFQVLLTDSSSPGGVAVIQPVLQPDRAAFCGRAGVLCMPECAADLTSDPSGVICAQTRKNRSQEIPVISRTVSASDLSDPVFAGILALIVFLSVLVVGTALWWWRDELRPGRSLTLQSVFLKESQDPLIQTPSVCIIEASSVAQSHEHYASYAYYASKSALVSQA
ncbi:low-density lipoprotein receptor-like [Neosynchiropus ocellatus]